MSCEELVVLLDEDGNAIGSAPKASVHHRETPLHLAFSCYVFDEAGRLLVTQRALDKPTFPGAWTNSVCGHPAPGERLADAVTRRAAQELGLTVRAVTLVLPSFRYVATMPSGVRENEMCPVFTAVTDDEVVPDRAEVAAVEWVAWDAFRESVLSGERQVSPWCAQQVAELATREIGDGFAAAAAADLPPAARPAGVHGQSGAPLPTRVARSRHQDSRSTRPS
jgi:isopentenyl-diphosphate delta-isomerase